MNILILIIDDSPDLTQILTDILSKQGYEIESCSDGESGWARLVAGAERRAPMPDLLLLDLNMPGIDGLTLLRRMRTDERFALLPVIILTVEASADTRLMALEEGANDYISKPVQTLELLARVKTLTGWKLAERLQQRRMERLIEVGRILLSTLLDLDVVLERVTQIVTEEMDAESASIWLRNAERNLQCRAASGKDSTRLLGICVKSGQGVAGWALQNKQSALITEAQTDPRFYREVEALTGVPINDLITVPLIVRDTCIGVLQAVNKRQDLFSPTDLAWMEVLAPLAASAIANAQLFQALRQRTAQLQTRNKELDAFAHTVAHDLKSPLTNIIGFAESLEEGISGISAMDLRRYLHIMSQSGRKMGRIIDELLLLAGVRKQTVEVKPLDMSSIVAEAIQRLAGILERNQAQVTLPDTWPTAVGYGPWIEEVWTNYISNAIKYGGQPPCIELGGTMQADGSVCFWARDNGPGLTPEAQAQLFVPFTRLDRSREEGHGLGLSIVRSIMEKLGGQVGVESTVGQGSTFFFTLPSTSGEQPVALD